MSHGARGGQSVHSILVVEDDTAVRKVIGSTLKRAGYSVILTRNAAEALVLVRSSPLDLLVADVVLPDVSGIELAAACRELQPGIRVLHISGYGVLELEAQGYGSVDILEKPFSPAILRTRVAALLEA